jgi:hypothetical protein
MRYATAPSCRCLSEVGIPFDEVDHEDVERPQSAPLLATIGAITLAYLVTAEIAKRVALSDWGTPPWKRSSAARRQGQVGVS